MPVSGAEASYGDLLLTSLVVLGGVCVAAFLVVRFVGRWVSTGRARGAHLLDVVARVPLEPRRSLYVVEVAGKTLLVGTSEMGLSVLTELDGAEVRSRCVERPSFGELVKQAWSRRRGLGKANEDPRSTSASDAGAATTATTATASDAGAATTAAATTTATASASPAAASDTAEKRGES
jgi:flagellar biogenesis protein FliO